MEHQCHLLLRRISIDGSTHTYDGPGARIFRSALCIYIWSCSLPKRQEVLNSGNHCARKLVLVLNIEFGWYVGPVIAVGILVDCFSELDHLELKDSENKQYMLHNAVLE
jgi:hypothetical protein